MTEGPAPDLSDIPEPDVSGTLEPLVAGLRSALEDHERLMRLAETLGAPDTVQVYVRAADHRWEHAGAYHTLLRWMHGPESLEAYPDVPLAKDELPRTSFQEPDSSELCVTQATLDEAMDRIESALKAADVQLDTFPETAHPILTRVKNELRHHRKELHKRYQEFLDTGKCC